MSDCVGENVRNLASKRRGNYRSGMSDYDSKRASSRGCHANAAPVCCDISLGERSDAHGRFLEKFAKAPSRKRRAGCGRLSFLASLFSLKIALSRFLNAPDAAGKMGYTVRAAACPSAAAYPRPPSRSTSRASEDG